MKEIQKLVCEKYPTKYLKNGSYEETEDYKTYLKLKKEGRVSKKDKPVRYKRDSEGRRIKVGPKRVPEVELPISGQDVYSGMNNRLRTELVQCLKDYYRPIIRRSLRPLRKGEYPVFIRFEIHTVINRKWDTSNMWIYGKVLEDTLKDEGIIIDDSNTYVTYPPTAPLLIPIEDWNNRKLVFKIINDNREILKNFKKWNASR